MSGIIGKDPFSKSGFLGSFASKGIDDNADANAITIDSAQKVGIGTSSPSNVLNVTKEVAGDYQVKFQNHNGAAQGLQVRIKGNDTATLPAFDVETWDTGTTYSSKFRVTRAGEVSIGSEGSFQDIVKGYGGSAHANKGTGVWEHFSWTTQCDNAWRNIISAQDTGGFIFAIGGDSGTRNQKIYSWKITSPGYGVSAMSQLAHGGGGWNSGSFDLTYTGNPYYIAGRASSYYSSGATATFQIYFLKLN